MLVSRDATLNRWGRRFAAFAGRLDERPRFRDRMWSLFFGGNVIGLHGKPQGAHFSAWMDLHLDLPALGNWASRLDPPLDFRPTWRGASWDHWAGFTWPPYMQFYSNILRSRRDWSLKHAALGGRAAPSDPSGAQGRWTDGRNSARPLAFQGLLAPIGLETGLWTKDRSMISRRMVTVGLATVIGTSGCQFYSDLPPVVIGGATVSKDQPIMAALRASSEHTRLVAALDKTGLTEQLSGPGPMTFFAPNDRAFELLRPKAGQGAIEAEDDILKQVLLGHIVPARLTTEELLLAYPQLGGKTKVFALNNR